MAALWPYITTAHIHARDVRVSNWIQTKKTGEYFQEVVQIDEDEDGILEFTFKSGQTARFDPVGIVPALIRIMGG